ncbi:hypothetical protein JOQ06_001384, partial [Pogonophryne albipinna]
QGLSSSPFLSKLSKSLIRLLIATPLQGGRQQHPCKEGDINTIQGLGEGSEVRGRLIKGCSQRNTVEEYHGVSQPSHREACYEEFRAAAAAATSLSLSHL